MAAPSAQQAAAHKILREVPFSIEKYPAPSPVRRLLVVGGRCWDRHASDRPIVLSQGATILLETRSRVLLEFIFDRANCHAIAAAPTTPAKQFRVSLRSLNCFVHNFNEAAGSNDSRITDTHGRSLTLEVPSHHDCLHVERIKAATLFNCTASMPSDQGIRCLRQRILGGTFSAQDLLDLEQSVPLDTSTWEKILKELVSLSRCLDQEAIALCRKIDKCGSKLYAYLRHDGSALARRGRHEAIGRFPFLAEYIATSEAPEAVAMRTLVDQGLSPIGPPGSPIVVSRDIVRAVAGKNEQDLGLKYEHGDPLHSFRYGPWSTPRGFSPSRMFRALEMVPKQQRPISRIQWRMFQEMASRIGAGWYSDAPGDIAENLLRSLAQMGWPSVIKNGAIETCVDFVLDDLKDFFNASNDALQSTVRATIKSDPQGKHVKPESQRAACTREIHALASRTGFRKLALLNDAWHARYALAIADQAKRLKHLPTSESIPPLLQGPLEINGLRIFQLLTRSDFLLEGMVMMHCVASLFEHGCLGGAAYFSVRLPNGERISTFDLSVRRIDGALNVSLNSHRGFKNREPPEQAVAAVREFIRQLQQGALEDAATRHVDRAEALKKGQIFDNSSRVHDALKKGELSARRLAVREALHSYMPKMLENALRTIGRCQ